MSRLRIPWSYPLAGSALALLAVGFAWSPLLAAGAVGGIGVISGTLGWPLTVVALMLALGPVDLSLLTGGTRGLLPALGGLDMSGIRLIAVSAGLGAVVLTRRDLLAALARREARWYALFLIWGAMTLALSPDPLEGLRLLLKLAYPLLLFLVVAAPERTPGEVRRATDWALWGATIILLLNPLVVANGGYAFEAGEVLRVSGPGSHYNPFSFYLLVVLLISIARFRTRGQVRYLALGAVALLWMALTLTRITFLASLVAMLVAGVYVAIMDRSVRALFTLAGAALLIAALVLRGVLERTFGYVPALGQLAAFATDPVALYNAVNWQGRETLWEILWLVFLRHPVTGSGLGASSAALSATLGGGAPHNEYLRLAVDTGIVGCVLFLLAFLSWVRAALGAARDLGRGPAEETTLAALGALGAWVIIATTDNAFDYYAPFTQYVAFLVAGCVVVARPSSVEERPAEAVPPPLTGELADSLS